MFRKGERKMKRKLLSMLMAGLCFFMVAGCASKDNRSVAEVINEGFENNDGSEIIQLYVDTEDMDIVYEIEDTVVSKFKEESKKIQAMTPEQVKETKYAEYLNVDEDKLDDTQTLKDTLGITKMIFDAPNETVSIPVDEACFEFIDVLKARVLFTKADEALAAKDTKKAKELYGAIVANLTMRELNDDVMLKASKEKLATLK